MPQLPPTPRLRQVCCRSTCRSFMVPMDHGIGMGPQPGLYDMRSTVEQMAGTGVNTVIVHKGLVPSMLPVLRCAPDVGLIVHLCASTAQAPDPNEKQLVCSVQEALTYGADGVSIHFNM